MDGLQADDITYRLFRLDPSGETKGFPVTIMAGSDDAAVRHAQKIASDVSVLLCKGTHMVAGWTAAPSEVRLSDLTTHDVRPLCPGEHLDIGTCRPHGTV